jgi:hypothetical protein
VVGLDPSATTTHFRGCDVAAHVTNRAGADNDENGTAIALCSGTRRPWSQMWGHLRRLG